LRGTQVLPEIGGILLHGHSARRSIARDVVAEFERRTMVSMVLLPSPTPKIDTLP
jgi:hypothetical protein